MAKETIWDDDKLNRREDAEHILRFLEDQLDLAKEEERVATFVLNIDAQWGFGKTFLLERMKRELTQRGHLVASVNAWRDDHSVDPLVAVMAAIEDTLAPHMKKEKSLKEGWSKAKSMLGPVLRAGIRGAAKTAAKKYIGDEVGTIAGIISDETEKGGLALTEALASGVAATVDAAEAQILSLSDQSAQTAIEDFRVACASIKLFGKQIEKLLVSIRPGTINPDAKIAPVLYVLVDELDRCRPPYAIALLERIKHLFEINNVVFIIATDTDQLTHAISAVYGTEFASGRYLRRFFDQTYHLPEPSVAQYVDWLLLQKPLNTNKYHVLGAELPQFLTLSYQQYGKNLSLRDIAQCHELLRAAGRRWNRPVQLELAALLPLIIGLKLGLVPAFTDTFRADLGKFSIAPAVLSGPTPALPHAIATDPSAIFGHYKKLVGMSLPATSNMRAENLGRMVQQRFGTEFHKLHQNEYRPPNEPMSIIAYYPTLVTMVGRFGPSPDTGAESKQ